MYINNKTCEPPPLVLNKMRPAFAAERRRLQHGARIDRYLLQPPALSTKPADRRCCCRSMGQTDRRTDAARYTDSAQHIMPAASIMVQTAQKRKIMRVFTVLEPFCTDFWPNNDVRAVR